MDVNLNEIKIEPQQQSMAAAVEVMTKKSSTKSSNSTASTNSLHYSTEESDEFEKSSGVVTPNELNISSLLPLTSPGRDDTDHHHRHLLLLDNELSNNKISCTSNSSSSSSSTTSSSNNTSGSNSNNNNNNNNSGNNSLVKYESQPNKYIFILDAFVNGFAQLKLCANKIDYEYIIEVYWSNEKKSFIKRTYSDFFQFHETLVVTFAEFFKETSNHSIQNNHLPSSLSNSTDIAGKNRTSRLLSGHIDFTKGVFTTAEPNSTTSSNKSSNSVSSRNGVVKKHFNGFSFDNFHLPVLPGNY
jgi:hypothetical protein